MRRNHFCLSNIPKDVSLAVVNKAVKLLLGLVGWKVGHQYVGSTQSTQKTFNKSIGGML